MAAGSPILTVTPNPSLDVLYSAERLVWDDANRVPEPRIRPGGQGINVSRAVAALGGQVEAVALLGGATGAEIRRLVSSEPIGLHVVESAQPSRIFVSVIDGSRDRCLHLNNPGPDRTAAEEEAFLDRIEELIGRIRPAWVACCGSVPPGFRHDLYRRVGVLARAHASEFAVDCDGPALLHAIRGGCGLLAPNRMEAARLTGRDVADASDATQAARKLLDPARTVAVTLGADGAVVATRDAAWHASLTPMDGVAVGAGDAFLAALMLALDAGRPSVDALADAVAAGAATLSSTGTDLLDPADFRAIRPSVRVTRMK